jgi:hypothetical protein
VTNSFSGRHLGQQGARTQGELLLEGGDGLDGTGELTAEDTGDGLDGDGDDGADGEGDGNDGLERPGEGDGGELLPGEGDGLAADEGGEAGDG